MIATTDNLGRSPVLFCLATLTLLAGGCGGSHGHASSHSHGGAHSPQAGFQTSELLDLLQEDSKRHDPQAYTEFDIGQFRVTRSLGPDGGTLIVEFHLYGVLPEASLPDFREKSSHYEKRLRDAVLSIVQSCDQNELMSPRLGVVKSQITRSINEMLHTRSLRNVVFSNLMIEKG